MGTGWTADGRRCWRCSGPRPQNTQDRCVCAGAPAHRWLHGASAPVADVTGSAVEAALRHAVRGPGGPASRFASSAARAAAAFVPKALSAPARGIGALAAASAVAAGGAVLASRWRRNNSERDREILSRYVTGHHADWQVLDDDPPRLAHDGLLVGYGDGEEALGSTVVCERQPDGTWRWEGRGTAAQGFMQPVEGVETSPDGCVLAFGEHAATWLASR